MSNSEQGIVCRRCREVVPVTGGNCPHCGASIRRNWPLVAVLLVGLVLVVTSLFAPSELLFFGGLGLLGVAIAGYLLYDKRKRIEEAAQGEPDREREGNGQGGGRAGS